MGKKFMVIVLFLTTLNTFICKAEGTKDIPAIKNTSVSIPVEEFTKLVKDAKISLSWSEFAKLLASEDGKYIRIPWETFLKYIEPAPVIKPARPPVDYILSDVTYTGKPETSWCVLNFSANLQVFKNPADGWTTIKLWPVYQSVVISEMTCNGKPANVFAGSDGNYQILINEQGNYAIEGKLCIKMSEKGESFTLASIPNTSCTLRLSLPKDYQVTSSTGIMKINRTKDSTEVELVFSPTGSMNVNWSLMSKEPSEPKIFAGVSISSYLQSDIIKTNASLRYNILYQPVKFLKILIPEGMRLTNVSGNFMDWKQTDSILQVELKPETKGGVNIDISYEQELKPDIAEISIKSPVITDAEATTGYFTIATTHNLGINQVTYEGLLTIDPKEVPAAPSETVLAYRFNRLPFTATVKITRYQELPVLEVTCDSVNAITAATIDGKTITRVIYHVRNNARQFLSVNLPENSQLWSVYVANNPTKPLAGKSANSVLIPLLRTSSKIDSAIPVEVIYYQSGTPFGKTGEFQINLPGVDIPVMHLMYSLYIPEKLNLDNFSGNLEKVEKFSPVEGMEKIPDRDTRGEGKKEVSRKETSQSEIYIVNQDVLEKNVQAALSDRSLLSGQGKPSADESSTGILPLRIYIPTTGKLLRFEKRLVMDENLFLKARYKLASR
ncbi:MAG TPA: hypothetical protein PK303_09330 [bacterium]|nr:hypothetical protein [bacterium]HOL35804.1 hypothetical protein [bacterium]HPP09299.1 hypothetical protein [bacterium]